MVNFETKGGGSHFHGEIYDLLQNDKLNANSAVNWANGTGKNSDHQNDFGANIGGPIYIPHLYTRRDRAFFFFNYEGYRFNHGENVYTTVPTALMRTGNFSELLTDPTALATNKGGRTARPDLRPLLYLQHDPARCRTSGHPGQPSRPVHQPINWQERH